jgi:serine/threonine protein kinase/WD40 repeat protein
MTERELFVAALHLRDAARVAFLDLACDDRAVRSRVDSLLLEHERLGGFLEPSAAPGAAAPDPNATTDLPGEQLDTVIAGKYKLMELIGEGGMGSVWRAQQTEPVKRFVAVKLIKSGMDSKAVLARFEAERQALAVMDHPNIARILDGGVTEAGSPFFVMELVKGVPITEFCDARKLTPKQRLELFVPVCQAIQHAHQKGIIHRDIKPSNVLIALYDDKAVPKVIDFGIAKATGQALTDSSYQTAFGGVVGTPEYMSPEQASLNNLDIDTRSDVYSLGVLLYELLAGSPPFRSAELKKAGMLEMLRVVREEEPPRPSIRLSATNTLPSISANRGTEPKKLTGLLRNELDWIVMKALEKDRARRYESANGFAADVQRHLSGEAVQAHPPSAGYRMRKFIRRHKGRVLAASLLLAALVAGLASTTWQAIRATHAEEAAHDEQKKTAEALTVADEQRKKAETQVASIAVDVDLKYCEDGEVPLGLLRLAQTLPTIPEHAKELRECAALNILAWGQRFRPAIGPLTHDGFEVTEALLSPDGRTVLTAGRDGTARLWDSLTGKQLRKLGQPPQENAGEMALSGILQFSKDGSTVLTLHNCQIVEDYGRGGLNTAGEGAVLRLWDVATGQLRSETAQHTGSIYQYSLSHNGSLLATSCHTQPTQCTLRIWDGATGQLVHKLDLQGSIISGAFSPDGKCVLIGQDQQFGVWFPDDHRPAKQLPGFNPELSPNGGSVASVERFGNTVYWWDTTDWHLQRTIDVSKESTGPYGYVYAGFITDDLLAVTNAIDWCKVFVKNQSTPIEYSGFISNSLGPAGTIRASLDGRLVLIGVNVYDTVGGQRIPPPRGRRFRPELRQFAEGNWFTSFHESSIIDLAADKKISLGPQSVGPNNVGPSNSDAHFLKSLDTCVMLGVDKQIVVLRKADASLDAQLLLQWCRVVTRGMLDERGRFSKFDEATWENLRQELSHDLDANPDASILRSAVSDRLYWLREEIKQSKSPIPLCDRLIEAEPTWLNYSGRAKAHFDAEHWDLAVRDQLDAARLRGDRYWRYDNSFTDPFTYLVPGTRLVQSPGLPREQYELALRWAEARNRAGAADSTLLGDRHGDRTRPGQMASRQVISLAQFRLGRYSDALATLRQSDVPKVSAAAGMLMSPWNLLTIQNDSFIVAPIDLAVRAMCHHHLGQPKAAEICLRMTRELLGNEGGSVEQRALLREAELLIEGNAKP